MQTVDFRVNGVDLSVSASPDMPLLWVIRDQLDLTGTKYGCGAGLCGACTVMMDGAPVRSCQITVADVAGAEVTTIEGLQGPVADAVRRAWLAHDVVQCGYCQSGQIISATDLLTETPSPDAEDISAAMDGNLCRCGSYNRIRAAIAAAADELRGQG